MVMAIYRNKIDTALKSFLNKIPKRGLNLSITENIARCYYWLGDTDNAKKFFIKSGESVIEKKFNDENLQDSRKAHLFGWAGIIYYKAGVGDKAEEYFSKSIEFAKKQLESDATYINGYENSSEALLFLDEYNEVINNIDILHIYKPVYPRYDAIGLIAKAKINKDINSVKKAIEILERGIKKENYPPYTEGGVSRWDILEYTQNVLNELKIDN